MSSRPATRSVMLSDSQPATDVGTHSAPSRPIRKHLCLTCSKTFAKSEHLIRHERSHTGVKPFACSWCHRSFSRQDSLIRHQQRHSHVNAHRNPDLDRVRGADPPLHAETNHDQPESTTTGQSEQQHQGLHVSPGTFDDHVQFPGNQDFPHPSLSGILAEDPFLQLTWPDSEDLLQSILSSNLVSWPQPLDNLPSQCILNERIQEPEQNPSPWLTDELSHQLPSGSHAVRNISQIISGISASVTSEAESAGLSTVFLDACLHMFFDQFVQRFPVCHRPTFKYRDWTHPLLINSIALGSLYEGQKVNIVKGEVLWTLAHTAVATSWHTLLLHRGPNDPCNGTQLLLTALLGQTYAMLSDNVRLRKTAQIFHSLGFYWARECGMYDIDRKFDRHQALSALSPEQRSTQWFLWSAEETQLRALLGHYILDGLLTQFTGAPTCQQHASNPLPLPSSEVLFQTSTADEWTESLRSEAEQKITFRQLFLLLFSKDMGGTDLPASLSLLTIKVILEGLKSFVSEANSAQGLVVGIPSRQDVSKALATLYKHITSSDSLLDGDKTELLLRWHTICIDAAINSTQLCQDLCHQFSVQETVFKKTSISRRSIDLKRWTQSSPGRSALLHATAIWEIFINLPFGRAHAMHVPISIFVAATIYCTFLLAGISVVNIPRDIEWAVLVSLDLEMIDTVQQDGDPHLTNFLSCRPDVGKVKIRNLLYDSNTSLIHLRQLSRPWGICTSLESIIQQLLSRCEN